MNEKEYRRALLGSPWERLRRRWVRARYRVAWVLWGRRRFERDQRQRFEGPSYFRTVTTASADRLQVATISDGRVVTDARFEIPS